MMSIKLQKSVVPPLSYYENRSESTSPNAFADTRVVQNTFGPATEPAENR